MASAYGGTLGIINHAAALPLPASRSLYARTGRRHQIYAHGSMASAPVPYETSGPPQRAYDKLVHGYSDLGHLRRMYRSDAASLLPGNGTVVTFEGGNHADA